MPTNDTSAKNAPMSAQQEAQPDNASSANTSAKPTGTVKFTEPRGAEIYVDGQFVGNIPSTLQLPEGTHKVLIKDGKSPDWQEGSSRPCRKHGYSPRAIHNRPMKTNRSRLGNKRVSDYSTCQRPVVLPGLFRQRFTVYDSSGARGGASLKESWQ